MTDELPTFESMFRKSKGLDLAEEAPSEQEETAEEKQRTRVYDKLTDEDGNSRLKYKANVPALENYDQDIRAPQGEVHDADKLKATRKSAGFREMVARKCFEKSGIIPDVEFMDSYTVRKAADETDFNEMADGFAAYNKEDEIQDTINRERKEMEEDGVEDGLEFRLAESTTRDEIEDGFADTDAELEAYNKYDHKKNKPIRKELSNTANWIRDVAADTAIAMAKDPTPQSRMDALMEGDLAGEIAADIPGIYHEVNPFLNKNKEFFTALDALLKKNPDITPNMIVKYMQPAKVGYNQGYKRRSQERMKDSSQ